MSRLIIPNDGSGSGGGSGTSERLSTSDKNLTPLACPASNGQDTGIAISETPTNDSDIDLLLNGVEYEISNLAGSGMFYFSNDGGTTAVPVVDVQSGDELYFNGANAGFGLSVNDLISLRYIVSI